MRLHRLVVACFLFLSTLVLAQHSAPGEHSTPGAAPSPPTAPPTSPPPSPAPPSTTISTPSISHTSSEPQSPKFEQPSFHSSPPSLTPVAAPNHNSTVDLPRNDTRILHSAVRGNSTSEIQHPPEGPKAVTDVKPIPPAETSAKTKSESEKAAPVDKGKPCRKDKPCMQTNGGEISRASAVATPRQCQPGTSGAACVANVQPCAIGASWNGTRCVDNTALCSNFDTRAFSIASEARSTRSRMEQACRDDPNGDECIRLTQEHNGDLLRYQGLLTEAVGQVTAGCQATFPDPLTL